GGLRVACRQRRRRFGAQPREGGPVPRPRCLDAVCRRAEDELPEEERRWCGVVLLGLAEGHRFPVAEQLPRARDLAAPGDAVPPSGEREWPLIGALELERIRR